MSGSLYREVDALGGAGMSSEGESWSIGYSEAIADVLAVLERRGFLEHGDPITAIVDAIKPILDDLGRPGLDGWTEGYAHTTDLDRLHAAIAEVSL